MSDPDDVAGWRAYGGAADRSAVARKELQRAEQELSDLRGRPIDGAHAADLATDLAEAWYRVGRATIRASYLPGSTRFQTAHDAMRQAVEIGEPVGTAEQRSRWWTGLGTSLKNLVTDPDNPAEHEANLELSLTANHRGLALARTLHGQPERLAMALTSTAMAYQYRDLGSRRDNIETATGLMAEAIDLRLEHGMRTPAAIAATSCGIAWVEHPDTDLGLTRALKCYEQAGQLLDAETFPAHARRLGRSAGWAACRQGDWAAAERWYDLAWTAVQALVNLASDLEDKRRELAEHGDSSSRHIYAAARAGNPNRAVHLADEYADVAASLASQPSPAKPHNAAADGHISGRRDALCYLACTHVGSIALLTTAPTAGGTPSPDRHQQRDVDVVLLDAIDADWLKDELAWPASVRAHGPGVSTQFIDPQARDNHGLSPDLLRRLADDCITPVLAAAKSTGWDHIYLVPRAVFAEAPLTAAWSLSATEADDHSPSDGRTEGHAGASRPAISLLPRAQLYPPNRNRSASAQPHLVSISVPGDLDVPLGWTEIESQALEALFPGTVTPLRGDAATVDRILHELPAATHVHFAGHGSFAPSNPMDTYFTCVDGRLPLADLAQSDALGAAELFIASGCSLGSSDNIRLPDEGLGLPSVMMGRFGCSLVAPIRPVYDVAAALFTIRTAELMWRDGLADHAHAVREAQRWLAAASTVNLLAWATSWPDVDLSGHISTLDASLSWRDLPDAWAPFSYFGW